MIFIFIHFPLDLNGLIGLSEILTPIRRGVNCQYNGCVVEGDQGDGGLARVPCAVLCCYSHSILANFQGCCIKLKQATLVCPSAPGRHIIN